MPDKINVKNLVLIIIVGFVLIGSNIGGLYIYSLDEAKNSVCAREMMDRGDLIVPTFNYELRTDKPPLHYYFMQLSYQLFGVNEFSARFFSVIMGVMTLVVVWIFSTHYLGQRTALYSSLVLLSSLHFVLQFHMAVPDPYLIFFMTLGFALFYAFYVEDKSHYLLLSYLSFGLATLAKGPVAIGLPALSILIFLISKRKLSWNYMLKLKPLWAIGVLAILVAPWFILVGLKTDGEWINEFFFRHNLHRYTSTMEGHGAIFLVTPIMVLIGLLPFSIIIFQAFTISWKQKNSNPILWYGIIISLTIIIFFSFSQTKLPNYTVPAYPFIAITIGYYLNLLHQRFSRGRRSMLISGTIYLVLMLALPVGLFYGLQLDPSLSHLSSLAWYFIIPAAGAVSALWFTLRHHFKGTVLALSISWIVMTLVFFYHVFPQVDKENPVAKILPLIDENRPIAVYEIYNPAFSFYIRKPFTRLESPEELREYAKDHAPAYLITRERYDEEIGKIKDVQLIKTAKDIFEIPTTALYKIK